MGQTAGRGEGKRTVSARVLLHVGLQKSGSTYLQHGLATIAHHLNRLGVLYPVRGHVAAGQVPNHQLAVYGLLPGLFAWVTADTATAAAEEWEWLQGVVAAADEPVIVSAEVLSYLGPKEVRTVVDALPADDVRVLVTSRRLDRLLTSSWQQNLRHGVPDGLERFLNARRDDRKAFADDVDDADPWQVWRAFDTASTVHRWGQVVGAENVSLVTSPGTPPELLWHRFVAALDVPGLPDVAAPDVAGGDANQSLRWAEAEILAGVNAVLTDESWSDADAARVRRRLVRTAFGAQPEPGARIELPGDWGDEVATWSEEQLEQLRESQQAGLRLVGDLDDLAVPREGRGPDGPSMDDMRRAAASAVLALLDDPGEAPPAPQPPPTTWRRTTGRVRRELDRAKRRLVD
jgi:hypothetical protein